MPITGTAGSTSSTSSSSGGGIVFWLLAAGVVAVSVSVLDTYNSDYAWGLVALILLSALILDRQSALSGLNAAFAAARG